MSIDRRWDTYIQWNTAAVVLVPKSRLTLLRAHGQIEPALPVAPALAHRFFTTQSHQGSSQWNITRAEKGTKSGHLQLHG